MIDSNLFDALDDVTREDQMTALAMIARGPLIKLQRAQLLERLTAGSAQEEEETLLKKIREYRTDIVNLDTLEQLGEDCARKLENKS